MATRILGYSFALLLAIRTVLLSGTVVSAQEVGTTAGDVTPLSTRFACFFITLLHRESERCNPPANEPPLPIVASANIKREEAPETLSEETADVQTTLAQLDALRRQLAALQSAQQSPNLPTPSLIFAPTSGELLSQNEILARIEALRGELLPKIKLAMRSPGSDHRVSRDEVRSEDLDDYLLLSGGTISGDLNINGELTAEGTTFNGVSYEWPSADGTDGQVLTTDGAGGLSWETVAAGGFSGGELVAEFITATGTAATSTFSHHISIATGAEYRIGGTGILTATSTKGIMLGDLSGLARGTHSLDLQATRNDDTQIASGNWSIAVGSYNTASNIGSVALGYENLVTSTYGVGVGTSNETAGNYALAIGRANYATAEQSIAAGYANEVEAGYSIGIGHFNQILGGGYYNIGIGSSNYFIGGAGESISIGRFNTVDNTAFRSVLIGRAAYVSGETSISIGDGASASSDETIAIGTGASGFGVGATAIGYSAGTNGARTTALGYDNTANAYGAVAIGRSNSASANGASVFGSSITNTIATSTMIGPSNTAKITILGATGSAGFVGIGTTTPASALSVVGDIRATGNFISNGTTLAVPDYVFEDDYQLMSLADLSTYVDTHEHLPNVPSRADIQKKGLNVTTFVLSLLEKIEELVLYVLDHEIRLKALEQGAGIVASGIMSYFEADEIRTKKLCIDDVCITKGELQKLLDDADVAPIEDPESEPEEVPPVDEPSIEGEGTVAPSEEGSADDAHVQETAEPEASSEETPSEETEEESVLEPESEEPEDIPASEEEDTEEPIEEPSPEPESEPEPDTAETPADEPTA